MIGKHKQLGFSLVELMIGLLIGLIATFVIMRVFTGFEQQKRTTIGSSDAQTNGNIALFTFQKDAESAGYGLPLYQSKVNNPLMCPLDVTANVDHDNDGATANVNVGVSPILVEDGGTGSDKVFVRYGTAMQGGGSVSITGNDPTGVSIENTVGCAVGDVTLVTQDGAATDCQFSTVLTKPSATKVTLANTNLAVNGNGLSCLGDWSEFQYQVNANQLERNGQVIVSDIVDMQVQYGVSVIPSNVEVSQWVDATGVWSKTNLTTDSAISLTNRNRIKAIRVAFVARSSTVRSAEDVTSICSSLVAANPTGLCAWDPTSANPTTASPAPSIDLTADADWRKYRYRVYETIIPIRNVIWQASKL